MRRIFQLSLLCLLPLAFARAQTALPAVQTTISKGEIQIEGKLSSVDSAQQIATVQVSAVTIADGTVSNFPVSRAKQVDYSAVVAHSGIHSSQLSDALRTGAVVRIIGRNSGDGKLLPARTVIVLPPPPTPTPEPMAKIEHPYEVPAKSAVAQVAAPPAADLNAAVVAFCQKNFGQKVGSGQCAALAGAALHAAGAHRRFPDSPGKSDYVWGKFVYSAEYTAGRIVQTGSGKDVKAGDIVQFRNCVFQTGRHKGILTHHTSIIESLSADGMTCNTLQENAGGKLYVTRGGFHLPDLKQGWIRIYEPVSATTKLDKADVPAADEYLP